MHSGSLRVLLMCIKTLVDVMFTPSGVLVSIDDGPVVQFVLMKRVGQSDPLMLDWRMVLQAIRFLLARYISPFGQWEPDLPTHRDDENYLLGDLDCVSRSLASSDVSFRTNKLLHDFLHLSRCLGGSGISMISKNVAMAISPMPKESDIDERGCPVEHDKREFGPLLMGTQRMVNFGWVMPHTNPMGS